MWCRDIFECTNSSGCEMAGWRAHFSFLSITLINDYIIMGRKEKYSTAMNPYWPDVSLASHLGNKEIERISDWQPARAGCWWMKRPRAETTARICSNAVCTAYTSWILVKKAFTADTGWASSLHCMPHQKLVRQRPTKKYPVEMTFVFVYSSQFEWKT